MPFIKDILVRKSKSAAASPGGSNCAVSAGGAFAVNLYANGLVWTWGQNNFGQLGNNSAVLSQITPVSIRGALKTFCKIGGSLVNGTAIDKNGRVWGWGENANGQIGDNTLINKCTPVAIAGATKTFCQISSGQRYTVAIDKNGRAWAWGINNVGQIGDNTILSKRTPVSVAGAVKTFCQISNGQCHTLAIDKNGTAWAWGLNNVGLLGDNTIVNKCTPVSVAGAVKTFCQIDAGLCQSVAIDKNGRAWAWGVNTSGVLGDNTNISKRTPVSVAGAVKTFCQISTGACHTVAIDKNGTAWAWGSNIAGQLGDNTLNSRLTPVSVGGAAKTFCKISTGVNYTIAIDKNGNTWTWGLNQPNGVLGINLTALSSQVTPISIIGTVKTFCEITGGGAHALAIDKNGRVWAWGLNTSGQAGTTFGTNAGAAGVQTPISVTGAVKTFCQITGGGGHTLAIDKNGRAWAWGSGTSAQLGDNTIVNKCTPVSVAGTVKTFCQIRGGSFHSVAIDNNGQVWSWGINTVGQLGDNTTISKRTPVSVAGAVKTFCSIGTGQQSSHTVAIDVTGQDLWAWGYNNLGQLGDRSTLSRLTPVKVCYPDGVAWPNQFYNGKIATGQGHTVVLDDVGQVWCWGTNGAGQLGDNTNLPKCTPVSIAGVKKTFCQIAAGTTHTMALDYMGKVWAWGAGTQGQRGDGIATNKCTPVAIAGVNKTFCKIAAGANFSAAIEYTGKAWAWGLNTNAQLGDNSLYRLTPVRVCNI